MKCRAERLQPICNPSPIVNFLPATRRLIRSRGRDGRVDFRGPSGCFEVPGAKRPPAEAKGRSETMQPSWVVI